MYRPGVQCMCDLTMGLTMQGPGSVYRPGVQCMCDLTMGLTMQGPGSVYRPGVQCMCNLTMGLTRGGGQCIGLGYSVCVTLPWVSPGAGFSVSAWGTVYV